MPWEKEKEKDTAETLSVAGNRGEAGASHTERVDDGKVKDSGMDNCSTATSRKFLTRGSDISRIT